MLQRAFSGFPNRAAGLGLLLLRVAIGAALLGPVALSVGRGPTATWSTALDALSILTAAALLTGTLTPAAGTVAAALSLAGMFGLTTLAGAHGLGGGVAPWQQLAMEVSVTLLGPGAYSVDARLFGRREIVVPRTPHPGSRDRH